MNQKELTPLVVIISFVLVALIAGRVWYLVAHRPISPQSQNNVGQSTSTSTSTDSESSTLPASTSIATFLGVGTSIPPTISTSTWLTYIDSVNGFSFQYPPDYEIDSGTYENIVLFPDGGIRIYHKLATQSILDAWESDEDTVVLSSTPMTVDGYPALYVVGEEPPGGGGDQIGTSDLLIVDNNTLIVDFFPSPFDALSDDNNPIPETILSSLRFF